jgi:uncharacterized protein (DUF1015 family)
MAEIRAFAGLRYRDDLDLSAVTCPPYDVLSPAEQTALQERSPYATARLILPTGDGDARYTNAADLFRTWIAEGMLRQDETPVLYVTRTEFSEPGTNGAVRRFRLGLVSLLRLYEYEDRVVLPHERTLTGPKADRLKLLRATGANFESIMGLVDDPDGSIYETLEDITRLGPIADFTGDDDQRHQLYAVRGPAMIALLTHLIARQPVFIADGHHRYETAVAFAKERGVLGTDAPEAFLLTTISTFSDPGLTVLPTHRLVRDTPPELRNLIFRHLEPMFDILENIDAADLEGRLRLSVENQPVFGLVMPSGTLYQLTLRDPAALADLLPADIHPSLQGLEVVILQHLVLDKALGIPPAEVATTNRLAYTRDMSEAIRRVHDGEFDLALLLGRPAVTAVRDVSLAGEVMPQKSTFFYPKLLSGLVMRPF